MFYLNQFWNLVAAHKKFCVLFEKGFLDEQFYELRRLEDETNPHFVAEVVTLFFQDAERLVDEMDKAL